MGQVRHGSATTTHAVRAAIQRSQASVAELSRELGINPKTVAKWRKRKTVEDQKTGPKEPRSTVLSEEEEAMVVAFRRHTLLPLDDCLYALQPSIPHLTRSSLHRCLQRHGISCLPDVEGDKPKRQRFKRYPIGYFHIDIAEVRTDEGRVGRVVDRCAERQFNALGFELISNGARNLRRYADTRLKPYLYFTCIRGIDRCRSSLWSRILRDALQIPRVGLLEVLQGSVVIDVGLELILDEAHPALRVSQDL